MISSSQKLKLKHDVGEIILVKVIEQLDAKSWIVSLQGTLIQVKNTTNIALKEGEMVRMRVSSLNPPQLSFLI